MFTEEKKNSQISQDSNNVYKPVDEIETSNFIKEIYKKNLPTEIVGTNTKNFIGNKLQCAKVLDLSRLSGIVEYLPEELYIKVKACTPISLIEESLEKNNQQLAFEPIDFGYLKDSKSSKGTAAGQLSCNFSGSRRFKVGSLRDHILGFRGVNGKGDIIKSGGTVLKNVTGYDLSKLVTGSFGTLTALTEITFKVLPKKDSISTLVIYLEDNKIISDLFDQLLSSSNEISGAVYMPNEPNNKNYTKNIEKIFKFNNLKSEEPFVAVRIEGSKKSIDERIQDISQELQTNKMKTSILDFYQSKYFGKKLIILNYFLEQKIIFLEQ
jgi:glycolate oxidase FAD binding subunit